MVLLRPGVRVARDIVTEVPVEAPPLKRSALRNEHPHLQNENQNTARSIDVTVTNLVPPPLNGRPWQPMMANRSLTNQTDQGIPLHLSVLLAKVKVRM